MMIARSKLVVALVGTLIVCLGTFSLAGGSEPADRPADLPGFPGAVHEPPAWVDGTEPFDVKAFFTSPAVEENAAFLYFDALFEFDAGLDDYFPASDLDAHLRAVHDRRSRLDEFTESLKADPWSVPVEKIDKLLADYEPGFRKLAEAQKRDQCVFETGIGLDASLSHAAASLFVARTLRLRTERDLDRGDIGRAIDGLAATLRLSRDLRRRGYALCQHYSFVTDTILFDDVLRQILITPGLTSKHCDHLLRLFEEREQSTVDPLSEAVRTEYVFWRQVFHDLFVQWKKVRGNKILLEESIQALLEQMVREYAMIDEDDVPALATRLRDVTEDDYHAEVGALDRAIAVMLSASGKHYARKSKIRQEALHEFEDTIFLKKLGKATFGPFSDSLLRKCARNQVLTGASRCLVALRHWQLTQPDEPATDLEKIVRSAGMEGVPIDAYSGEPFKMKVIDGEPVIYSVGRDGKDDRGAVDWKNDTKSGDALFRIELINPLLLPLRP